MDITGITIARNSSNKSFAPDGDYIAFCDTGVFKEGKCEIDPARPDFNCPIHKKDVCCIVCELLEKCEEFCERINPD